MFIIAIESLACKTRQSDQIKGIKLPFENYPKNEARISLYADDITLFVTDERDIQEVIRILDDFALFSGLKLNERKTEAIWIGSQKKSKRKLFDLNWKLYPNNNVKSLGVHFSSQKSINDISQNWEVKVKKINKKMSSLEGKKFVYNMGK